MLLNKTFCSAVSWYKFWGLSDVYPCFWKVNCVPRLKNYKMFLLVSILIVALTSSVLCYDEKYDEIDVDAVLADDALFTSYLECFLEKGPCTAKYSTEFKELLSEVVATACEKCTDPQKVKVRKIVRAIFEKKSEMAEDFRKKFDPNGDHEKQFLAFMDKKN